MDQRQYMEAKELYESIPGFLDSDVMELEALYRRAGQLADANDFTVGGSLYKWLAARNYKDSAIKETETRYRSALYLMYEKQDYLKAYKILKDSQYNDMNNISDIRNELKELLYVEAIIYYQDGQHDLAKERFVKGYKDSDNYRFLIDMRTLRLSSNNYKYKDYVKKLIDMFYFADTSEVLLSTTSLATVFLHGTWKGDGHYLTMSDEYRCSHSFPETFSGRATYSINDGIYSLRSEDATFDDIISGKLYHEQFHITALAPNCIEVFCYKNNKTYTLYKQ